MSDSEHIEDDRRAAHPLAGAGERWLAAVESYRAAGADPAQVAALEQIVGGWRSGAPASAFADALQQTALAISLTDPEGNVFYVNTAFERMTGYALEELIGRNQSINSHKETPVGVYKALWDTILAGETWRGRLINRRKTGEPYVSELTITPIRSRDGAIEHMMGIHADVTDIHEMERTTANQKRLSESVINAAPVAMALVDSDGEVVLDNLVYKTLLHDLGGVEPAELFLKELADVLGPDLKAAAKRNTTFSNVEVVLDVGPRRGQRWYSCSGDWVKQHDPSPDNYFRTDARDALLLVCTDITPQRREFQRAQYAAVRAMMLEQQMAQRIREVVSAAVFQLQGPLNVIRAMSEMLRRQKKADPSIEAALTQVIASSEEAVKTLENALPRGVEEAVSSIPLNEVIRDVLVLSADRMTANDIEIDWLPSVDPLLVQGKANALRNLFKNVLDNALDAVEQSSDPWRKVRVVSRAHGDGRAEISIEDSGPGMPRDVRSRAFEPFFSGWTRPRGQLGMGLALARQIADDHGGGIEIEDARAGGCRVRIVLPLLNDPLRKKRRQYEGAP